MDSDLSNVLCYSPFEQQGPDEDWKVWSVIIFEKLTTSLNILVDQELCMAILLWVFIAFLAIRAQWYYETKLHIA